MLMYWTYCILNRLAQSPEELARTAAEISCYHLGKQAVELGTRPCSTRDETVYELDRHTLGEGEGIVLCCCCGVDQGPQLDDEIHLGCGAKGA